MTSRIVAVGMLVAFLGVAGMFVTTALLGPKDDPPSASASREPILLTQNMGKWKLHTQLVLSDTGTYELSIRFVDEDGGPASSLGSPIVRIAMLDHNMGTTSQPAEQVGIGSYRAVGSLSMDGRWRFRIELENNQADMIVNFRR